MKLVLTQDCSGHIFRSSMGCREYAREQAHTAYLEPFWSLLRGIMTHHG